MTSQCIAYAYLVTLMGSATKPRAIVSPVANPIAFTSGTLTSSGILPLTNSTFKILRTGKYNIMTNIYFTLPDGPIQPSVRTVMIFNNGILVEKIISESNVETDTLTQTTIITLTLQLLNSGDVISIGVSSSNTTTLSFVYLSIVLIA